jgi:hypothetical protein
VQLLKTWRGDIMSYFKFLRRNNIEAKEAVKKAEEIVAEVKEEKEVKKKTTKKK